MTDTQSNTSDHVYQLQPGERVLPPNPCKQRTQALVDSGYSPEWQVAFTAADYIYALENPVYAKSLGGSDNALAELKLLVNQWQNSFEGADGTDINLLNDSSRKWETSVTPAKAALHKMVDELPSSFSEDDCLFLTAIIGSFSALPPAALLQQLHSDCG